MGFKVRTVWAFEESFLLKIQIEESNQVTQQNALFYWNNIGISIKQSITKFGSLNEDWYIRVSHDVRTAVVYCICIYFRCVFNSADNPYKL